MNFYVPSSTTEAQYKVTVECGEKENTWHCTCPARVTCKHIKWMKWRVANHLWNEPGKVRKELIQHVR
jgi:uncharacterized Zn finger protein